MRFLEATTILYILKVHCNLPDYPYLSVECYNQTQLEWRSEMVDNKQLSVR